MSNSKLRITTNNILTCAMYAIIGLLLIILRGESLGILMTVVGLLLIAMGIVDVVKNKETVKGIIEAVAGLAIIVFGWTVASIVLLIFGIFLIVKGVMELFQNMSNGFMAMLSSIVTIIIGVLLVIAKWTLLDVMCLVAGIIFMINAALVLFGKKAII